MRKLLIAQHSQTMVDHLQHALHDEWEIHICMDSYPIIDIMEYMKPEAMILDLNLGPKDGITVLKESQPFLPSAVIATSNYVDDHVAETVADLGVGALVHIPFRMEYLKQQLDLLMERCEGSLCNAAWHLRALGINPKLSGYRCLLIGIQLLSNNRNLLLKEIYPTMAKVCAIRDLRCIERVIRTAIKNAWENRNPDIWTRYFPGNNRPTNKEFMTRIAEEL